MTAHKATGEVEDFSGLTLTSLVEKAKLDPNFNFELFRKQYVDLSCKRTADLARAALLTWNFQMPIFEQLLLSHQLQGQGVRRLRQLWPLLFVFWLEPEATRQHCKECGNQNIFGNKAVQCCQILARAVHQGCLTVFPTNKEGYSVCVRPECSALRFSSWSSGLAHVLCAHSPDEWCSWVSPY